MLQTLQIATRSLLQHRRRTFVLGGAIAAVTALLVLLVGLSVGMQRTMLVSATTLMTGHVNVAGFYKVTAGQSAPVVTRYREVLEVVRREVPELDYVTQRGRGWAKLVSDTSSLQVGLGGVDIAQEPGFRKVIQVRKGRLDDLAKPNAILLFEKQAKELEVGVGDMLTISAPTPRGVNNTLDVTVVAIAADIGLLSSWNVYLQDEALRKLYQLNTDTTGALQLYLKDVADSPKVQARLRERLAQAGYGVMDNDPRAFWMKFEVVNREDWTGQKLDITHWEDEISFIKWTQTAVAWLSGTVVFFLVVIICAGMMNVLWISIRERTREIGTLRAIGMQRPRVLALFMAEAFLLCIVGQAAGVVVGLALSSAINALHVPVPMALQLFLMTDHVVLAVNPEWLAWAVGLIGLCITTVSLLPSFLAARMKPITAMQHIG